MGIKARCYLFYKRWKYRLTGGRIKSIDHALQHTLRQIDFLSARIQEMQNICLECVNENKTIINKLKAENRLRNEQSKRLELRIANQMKKRLDVEINTINSYLKLECSILNKRIENLYSKKDKLLV